jgi:hypothetical protein
MNPNTCSLWSARDTEPKMLSGGDSGGEPPVPIPNTEVKPASADGTWGAIPWESRSLPDTPLRTKAAIMRPLFAIGACHV